MILPRPIYSSLLYVAAPIAMTYLMKRSRKQPEYTEYWGERFGWGSYPPPVPGRTRIWIHAVSVGETRATFSLVEKILKQWPSVDILYTHMTPTGRAVGEKFAKKFGNRITQAYLPYDTPFAVKKFLKQTKPAICLLMETEVWPNLTFFTQKNGIPTVLVNGRLSEKSLKKTLKVGSLLRNAMARLSVALAQSEEDAKRLEQVGCKKVLVLGNLKFDFKPNSIQVRTGDEIAKLSERKVLAFASSREGEEKLLLEAYKEACSKGQLSNTLLLIIPRHPQRFNSVCDLVKAEGLSVEKRSDMRDWKKALSLSGPKVIVGDSMGEMAFYYALSDVVIMGGSFGDYGSQSVIEPCALGVPVIVGPSIFNFEYIIKKATEANAVINVKSFNQAFEEAQKLLEDQGLRVEAGIRSSEFAASQRGATEKTLAVIDSLLSQKMDSDVPEEKIIKG